MSSKYCKNCVLTGVVDSFCLPCQTYISKKGFNQHIRTETHKTLLKDTEYLEKYKEDHIRKVKIGYFCEECNLLIKTLTKVDLHVKESFHIANVKKHFFKEVEEGVVLFEDILIEKQAWNGLNNGTCYICSIEYTNENDHKNKTVHILNLILSKVELQRNQFVYRKVDDFYFNCLTCNNLISLKLKDSHTENMEHVNLYSECKEKKKNLIDSKIETLKKVNIINHEDIQDELNLSNDKCNISVVNNKEKSLKNKNVINETNSQNEDTNKIFTPAEAFMTSSHFAKMNHLRYKRNNAYCKICDVKISGTLKKMKEHVNDQNHQEKTKIPHVEKMRTCEFIYSKVTVKELFLDNTIVNDKFCMSALSYNFIIKIGSRFRCLLCQKSTTTVEYHKRSVSHEEAMLATSVIMNFDSEFIREIRPEVYHCSVCNSLESGWRSLTEHLQSTWHADKNGLYRKFMNEYKPGIMEHKRKEDLIEFIRDLHCRGRK